MKRSIQIAFFAILSIAGLAMIVYLIVGNATTRDWWEYACPIIVVLFSIKFLMNCLKAPKK